MARQRPADVPESRWSDEETVPTNIVWTNCGGATVTINWLQYNGSEVEYSRLRPHTTYACATFNTHTWVVRRDDALLGWYHGPSADVTITSGGTLSVGPLSKQQRPTGHPSWGAYRPRGSVGGIAIQAWDCVGDAAIRRAEHIVASMLADAEPGIVRRLEERNCAVAVIGCHQQTTDIPEHSFMKHHQGRDIDATTRGLGATVAVPVCSVGEENVLMRDDRRYPCESILVHEFAHAVMDVGFDDSKLQRVRSLYADATRDGLHSLDCYMMVNASEYWAEGSQAWFDATIRTDVTDGVTSRSILKRRDPGLAALMEDVYGDGRWRYLHTAPTAFAFRGGSSGCSPKLLACCWPVKFLSSRQHAA